MQQLSFPPPKPKHSLAMANHTATTFKLLLLLLFLYLSLVTTSLDAYKRLNIYNKRYIEDSCYGRENIIYDLDGTGSSSVVKIGATRQTWFNPNRSCLVTIRPPMGYGVIFRVESMYFGSKIGFKDCTDYVQVFGDAGNYTKLCGFLVPIDNELTFATMGGMRLRYHTSEYQDVVKRTGFTVIITAFSKAIYSCAKDEFLCNNGRCIWEGLTCDGIDNCGDFSDETPYGKSNCEETPDFTIEPFDIKWELIYPTSKVRPPYSSSTMAPVSAAITCITGLLVVGILRIFWYYHCSNARRRNALTGVAVIRTRNASRRTPFNLHGPPPPPPYTSLINDDTMNHPTVSFLNPPPYAVVARTTEPKTRTEPDASSSIPSGATERRDSEQPSRKNESTSEDPPPYEP